eukprot:1118058-Pleurochrysis_carterae.AAC.1
MSLLFSRASPACSSFFPPYLGWTQSTTQWGPERLCVTLTRGFCMICVRSQKPVMPARVSGLTPAETATLHTYLPSPRCSEATLLGFCVRAGFCSPLCPSAASACHGCAPCALDVHAGSSHCHVP